MVSGVKFDDDASLPQELEVNDFLNMTMPDNCVNITYARLCPSWTEFPFLKCCDDNLTHPFHYFIIWIYIHVIISIHFTNTILFQIFNHRSFLFVFISNSFVSTWFVFVVQFDNLI